MLSRNLITFMFLVLSWPMEIPRWKSYENLNKILIKILSYFLTKILTRFLQVSYKILTRFLPDSYNILQDLNKILPRFL